MDARLVSGPWQEHRVQGVSIGSVVEGIRLGFGKMPFNIISGRGTISFSLLLIDSHNLEPETSGGGGELRIVGQQ
jgi:hypothetical protein